MPMHSLLLVGAERHPDKVFQCLMVPIGIELRMTCRTKPRKPDPA